MTHKGACTSTCDGFIGQARAEELHCEYPAGSCTVANNIGACINTPTVCTEPYDPVCGCDGQTYDNECFRLQAQVQKASDGACDCPLTACSAGSAWLLPGL